MKEKYMHPASDDKYMEDKYGPRVENKEPETFIAKTSSPLERAEIREKHLQKLLKNANSYIKSLEYENTAYKRTVHDFAKNIDELELQLENKLDEIQELNDQLYSRKTG